MKIEGFSIECNVASDDIIDILCDCCSQKQVINFILEIEERMNDIDFTKELRDALNEIIKEGK